MLVNTLTGCPIRSLILEVNDNQMLSALPSPHPPYGSARKGEGSGRVWMLLQAQQNSHLPVHHTSMAKSCYFPNRSRFFLQKVDTFQIPILSIWASYADARKMQVCFKISWNKNPTFLTNRAVGIHWYLGLVCLIRLCLNRKHLTIYTAKPLERNESKKYSFAATGIAIGAARIIWITCKLQHEFISQVFRESVQAKHCPKLILRCPITRKLRVNRFPQCV